MTERGDNYQHYRTVASLRNVETRKSSISELNYYWEDITRVEANEKLLDAVDGSFLVRDSSTEGEYTLVLRKNGTNKCIKILHQEGKYGFVEPCTFNSISDIVDYFSKNSLEQYNPALDIKLLYPICNNNDELVVSFEDIERAMHYLVEINTSHLDLVKSFNRDHRKFDYVLGEMKRSHLTIEALGMMRRMFQEQQILIENNQNMIKAEDVECISNNIGRLTSRLNEIEQNLQQQYIVIKDYSNQYNQLTADICNKKLEIKRSNQLRNNIRRRVINLGISDNYVDGLLEEEKDEDIPHYDTRLWLLQKDRTEANILLENKPHGSFLVRPKDTNTPYILSVKCVDKVEHCIIYFNKNKKTYGFTKEFCFFKTLTDLVIKYRRISLVTHNENVDVNLIYPALSVH
ncbi:phosphatidylinositol 3-kinase regulatory subunit gamma [Patella vulgata]|uniref:phosphatidylinositol 3-kinase regulatory subunit gamma n=1 Tax=Patella vulgata TaxID=6465 RepID=UPI00217F97C7|nr:phosphatidylinositol 3-kinase regulatory subunit gamma [Patella vulgata]